MSGLKIYACSGIGKTEKADNIASYWRYDTKTAANTQAVNSLLVKINLGLTEAAYLRMSEEERVHILNEVDLYCICLYCADKYKGDPNLLHRAGEVIGMMVSLRYFESSGTDVDERDTYLDKLVGIVDEWMENDRYVENPEFMAWWEQNIEQKNIVFLTPDQQKAGEAALQEAVSGIGAADEAWKLDNDISNYLVNSKDYFLYTYFTEAQLAKLPAMFKVRRDAQLNLYQYCKDAFVGIYGSEEDLQDIIRDGIIRCFGEEPEVVCAEILKGDLKVSGIGVAPAAPIVFSAAMIVKIIIAVLTFVSTIIVAILKYVRDVKVARYQAISEEDANRGIPNPDDFDGLTLRGGGGTTKSAILFAIVLAGVALYKKFKRKK